MTYRMLEVLFLWCRITRAWHNSMLLLASGFLPSLGILLLLLIITYPRREVGEGVGEKWEMTDLICQLSLRVRQDVEF